MHGARAPRRCASWARTVQRACFLGVICFLRGDCVASSQEPPASQAVSPAIVRAAVDNLGKPQVAPALVSESGRGEDFFRSAVIEALGGGKATYAVDRLTAIATQDGPLLDETVLALGRIGDTTALDMLADVQRNGALSLAGRSSAASKSHVSSRSPASHTGVRLKARPRALMQTRIAELES
jgi:HEAT repeat protein